MDNRIKTLEETFNERLISLRNEMPTRFEAINIRIDSLEKRIPMMEKLTELEIRISRLEKEK